MTTQCPTPPRLVEYINSIFDNLHGHQRNAICDFVLALLSTKSCRQAALARFFDNFEAASRRLTRFLHNPRLEVAELTRQTARVLVSQLPLVGTIRLSEAILAGGSSGAVIMAIERMRHTIAAGATCVAIFPDRGERYLDTIYSDGWVEQH